MGENRMKKLWMAGHHVRKGQAVVLLDSEDPTIPVKFFGEMRASKVRSIVDRFNRMQVHKSLNTSKDV